MLVLDFKTAEPLTFERYFGPYLKKNYGEKPETFQQDFSLLDALRKEVTTLECSVNSVKACYKYYQVLQRISTIFPIDENNIKLAFSWGNSLPANRKPLACVSIRYEMAAVLFNAALIYWTMASKQSLESTESLKVACNYYMNASFLFKKILNEISGSFSVPAHSDLSSECLISLEKLMLGFAQQCFVEKVIREDGKDTLVSKLAASCSDFFNTSLETIRGSPLEAAFGPQWIGNLKAMGLYYSSLSQKRKAEEVLAGRKFGEHIGRLTIAVRDAQGAIGLGTTLPSFILSNMKTSLAGMQSVLDEANKDNDMIYHETIPDNKKLAILPRAEMVAPKDPLPEGVQTADLFRHVVPLHIHQASTKYEDSKDKVVMKISKDFDLAADEITRALNKLNLPGALESEVLKGLPDSILKRSEELRKRGAPNDLMNGVDQIKGLSGRAKALLEFCRDALEGERADDDQMRLDFGVKWTRPASSKVNSKLVANLDKYFSAYQDAHESDVMLLQKYEDVIPDLMVLAGPRDELERNIPACSALSVGIINPAAEVLRKDLTALESLRMAAHDSLGKILELANKDLVGTLKTAVDPYEITKQTLMAIEEEKQQLDKLLAEQSNVIDRIKVSNTAFLASRKATPALKQREDVINRLEVAYQTYKTLLSNVVEGNKFYLDLVGLCEKLHKNVEEFLLSRKIEYNDIYRSIQDLASSLEKKKSADKAPATSKVEREIADSATVSTFGSIDIHARRKSDAPAFPPAPAFQASQSAGGANFQGYDTSYQGQSYSQAPPQNYAPPQQAYVPAPYAQPSYGGAPAPYQQPGAPYQQPGAPYQQPGAPYQQPGAPYQQPGAPYQQPGAPYQQPGAPYQQGPPNGQPWTPGMPVQYGQPPQLPPRQ